MRTKSVVWGARRLSVGVLTLSIASACGDDPQVGDGAADVALADDTDSRDVGQDDVHLDAGDAAPPDTAEDTAEDTTSDTGRDVAQDPATDLSGDAALDAPRDGEAPPVCDPPAADGDLQIRTTFGTYQGWALPEARRWRGIPYAAAPTNERRWQAPASPACETEVVRAEGFGPKCAQRLVDGTPDGEEDCLTLNLWAPNAEPPEEGWPVMVFVHGGGNVIGSARERLFEVAAESWTYDGQYLAREQNVVVVTVQYRLGVFGYLAHPALVREEGGVGNLGILDQQAALRWVQQNVRQVGGDPDRVLLFGESAGAVNTCVHLAAPASAGLFHAAAMQSGACVADPLAQASSLATDRVAASSCAAAPDIAACLRALPLETMLEEFPGSVSIGRTTVGPDPNAFGPVVDGVVLPETPLAAIVGARHNAVPVIVGSNGDEMSGAVPPTVADAADFERVVRALVAPVLPLIPTAVDALLAAYPLGDYPSPQLAFEALLADMRFNCTSRHVVRTLAEAQPDVAVHRYFFTRRATTASGPTPARHGIELLSVFGSMRNIPRFTPAPADAALSVQMMERWGNFARTGIPSATDEIDWLRVNGVGPTIVFDDPTEVQNDPRGAQCDVWDDLLGR